MASTRATRSTSSPSERGATVVARTLLRRDRLEAGVDEFVFDALATVPA
jgi:hypothetical protein